MTIDFLVFEANDPIYLKGTANVSFNLEILLQSVISRKKLLGSI